MKRNIYVIFILTLLFSVTTNSYAAAPQWKIDPAHSGIYFGVTHIYATVEGFFNEFEGLIEFDPANLKESRFDFSVTVKSINTNNSKRDGHLQSGDFFDVGKYPQMTFTSTSITHTSGDRYDVDGVLSIKDVSQNVTVPVTFFGTKPHPANPKLQVAGFEARMNIDRLAYHVGSGKFYQMGLVGKEVNVLISIEATREN